MRKDYIHDDKHAGFKMVAQYKIATRLIRYGQLLPATDFKVLMFIFDRTVAYNCQYESIPYRHFLGGVRRRKDGALLHAPTGVGLTSLKASLRRLTEEGVLFRSKWASGRGTFYSINHEWMRDELPDMWHVEERDYEVQIEFERSIEH